MITSNLPPVSPATPPPLPPPISPKPLAGTPRRKSKTKPDETPETIVEPCTECGKRFISPKALCGHMRCHPERHWRGIKRPATAPPPPPPPPPPTTQQPPPPPPPPPPPQPQRSKIFTEEEYQVAVTLILLAKEPRRLVSIWKRSDSGEKIVKGRRLEGSRKQCRKHPYCSKATYRRVQKNLDLNLEPTLENGEEEETNLGLELKLGF